MDITEIKALLEQFRCLAGAEFPNDPSEIGMAIDRKGFDVYFIPEVSGKPSPSNLIYDRIFSFYDRNDDGLIGFEEFIQGLSELQDKSRMARLKRIFLGYDLDADGYVCRKDFLRMFRAYYDLSRQLNREMIANQEEVGNLEDEVQEVVRGSQPLSAAFAGNSFAGHLSRTGMGKSAGPNGDLLITGGSQDVLQPDQDMHGDRERAISNAAVGHRLRSHPFRSFRPDPAQDEPLMQLPIPNSFELLGIQHADDATEEDFSGPDPPFQAYGWPPLLSPEPEDIVSALGQDVSVDEVVDPLDRSRVIYAQSQRLDAESDRFMNWTRQKAIKDRYKRRQFYLDEEEGFGKPQGYTEPDSSDDEMAVPAPKTGASSRRQSLRSRSSSKVRFDDSAIDTDYETRSNASSRSIPLNERWGGYELSHPEFEVGQDILYQAVQQGFNELLDPLFKGKENRAMEAEDSRKLRDHWKDIFEVHKQSKLDGEAAREQALKDADMLRTEELLNGGEGTANNQLRQENMAFFERVIRGPQASAPDPDPVFDHECGQQIKGSVVQAVEELKLASALTALTEAKAKTPAYRDGFDPTLPQFKPNVWDIVSESTPKIMTQPPAKDVMDQWMRHGATEEEAQIRGGPGRLTFDEFRWRMRKQDDANNAQDGIEAAKDTENYWEESADLGKLSFAGTWLEMASF